MTPFGAADLEAMFADCGVRVVFGNMDALGIRDEIDQDSFQDASISFTGREVKVTLETVKFLTMKTGDAITVDDVDYSVIQVRRIGDGALTEVLCLPA